MLNMDEQWMARALELAGEAIYRTSPNPRVGCVLVNAEGMVIGEGATQKAGGAHAEVMALRDADARGQSTQGATAYVTLEPCAHFGRTGPCCDALIRAGVGRVVAALDDPNPKVAGQGFSRLEAAGVRVEVGMGAEQSRELNLGFLSRFIRQTPWVRLKVAASLDGKTALPDGSSQWITSAQARQDGHFWRARACAILTGIGTVLADNPRLDVRGVNSDRQPRLVVLDSQLRTPTDAAIFQAQREVLIYTASSDMERSQALQAAGASVICMAGPDQRVDLRSMLTDLAKREVNELHVEAGQGLNAALLQALLVDELLVYLAPCVLGQGKQMFPFGPLQSLKDKVQLNFNSVSMVGPDLRIVARIQGREALLTASRS